jgi:DNA recombination protein RmuC
MEIAKRGGQLYDKFVGFVNTMQELGGTITKAQTTYDKAFGQLTTGSGNLVRQAEMMRKLEIKATKKLPEQIINEAMDVEVVLPDDENNEPISLN